MDVDRQIPGVMRTAHNAGGICVGSIHPGVHLQIVGVLCFLLCFRPAGEIGFEQGGRHAQSVGSAVGAAWQAGEIPAVAGFQWPVNAVMDGCDGETSG